MKSVSTTEDILKTMTRAKVFPAEVGMQLSELTLTETRPSEFAGVFSHRRRRT